ncbi:MAG: hypothetical protein ACRCYP_01690 [Alphaproteobacteria bacterium]
MDKATILKSFGHQGQDGQWQDLRKEDWDGTCKVIGVPHSSEFLDGADLANFDLVRRWFNNKEVDSYKKALDRFKAQPKQGGVLVEAVAPLGGQLALEVLGTLPPLAKQAREGTQKVFLKSYCSTLQEGAQSPEFRQAMDQAVNGEAIDVDFFLTGTETPQLPPSQP